MMLTSTVHFLSATAYRRGNSRIDTKGFFGRGIAFFGVICETVARKGLRGGRPRFRKKWPF